MPEIKIPPEVLEALAKQSALNPDVFMGTPPPTAPAGTEPPEFYSDVANAGLTAAMPPVQVNPAMAIAQALVKKRQNLRR